MWFKAFLGGVVLFCSGALAVDLLSKVNLAQSSLAPSILVQIADAPYPLTSVLIEIRKEYKRSFSENGEEEFSAYIQPLLDAWRKNDARQALSHDFRLSEFRTKLLVTHSFIRKPEFTRYWAVAAWLYEQACLEENPGRLELSPLLRRYLETLDAEGEEKLLNLAGQWHSHNSPSVAEIVSQRENVNGSTDERRKTHLRLLRSKIPSLRDLYEMNHLFFGFDDESSLRHIQGKADLPPLVDSESFTEDFVTLYFNTLGALVRSARAMSKEIWRGILLLRDWYRIDPDHFPHLIYREMQARSSAYSKLVAEKMREFVSLYLALSPTVQEALRRAVQVAKKFGLDQALLTSEMKRHPVGVRSSYPYWTVHTTGVSIEKLAHWPGLFEPNEKRPLCAPAEPPIARVFEEFLGYYAPFFTVGASSHFYYDKPGLRPPFSAYTLKLFYELLERASAHWNAERKIRVLVAMAPSEYRVKWAQQMMETHRNEFHSDPDLFLRFLTAVWEISDPQDCLGEKRNGYTWWRAPNAVGMVAEPWVEEFLSKGPSSDQVNALYQVIGVGAHKLGSSYHYQDSLSMSTFAARIQQWLSETGNSPVDLSFLNSDTRVGKIFYGVVSLDSPEIAGELRELWKKEKAERDEQQRKEELEREQAEQARQAQEAERNSSSCSYLLDLIVWFFTGR